MNNVYKQGPFKYPKVNTPQRYSSTYAVINKNATQLTASKYRYRSSTEQLRRSSFLTVLGCWDASNVSGGRPCDSFVFWNLLLGSTQISIVVSQSIQIPITASQLAMKYLSVFHIFFWWVQGGKTPQTVLTTLCSIVFFFPHLINFKKIRFGFSLVKLTIENAKVIYFEGKLFKNIT